MIDQATTTAPMEVYRQHLAQGQLAYQFSPSVNKAVFYPRILCPFTGTDTLEWRIGAGRGTIYSRTVVSQRDRPDRCIILVDLDEGYRMMSRIEGVPTDRVNIGDRVVVRIAQDDPDWDQPYPTFVLEEAVDAA